MTKADNIDEAYVKRMLSSTTMYSDDVWWRYDSRLDSSFSVTLFMVIRDIILYKRLTHALNEPDYFDAADGREIQVRVEPDFRGFAYYWLARPIVRASLEQLIKVGLIQKSYKNSGPSGYGCDQLYKFTFLAYSIMSEAKEKGDIKRAVVNVIQDRRNKN